MSADEIARLNALEGRIVDQFLHRKRVAPDSTQAPLSLGDRVADRVTAFGGSWTFISLTVVAIAGWMFVNATKGKAFDPYPYILLNVFGMQDGTSSIFGLVFGVAASATNSQMLRCQRAGNCAPAGTEVGPTSSPSTNSPTIVAPRVWQR